MWVGVRVPVATSCRNAGQHVVRGPSLSAEAAVVSKVLVRLRSQAVRCKRADSDCRKCEFVWIPAAAPIGGYHLLTRRAHAHPQRAHFTCCQSVPSKLGNL